VPLSLLLLLLLLLLLQVKAMLPLSPHSPT
jgi:hypothetical protein